MRVAAVALVLIVGAAMVLAFANTLNSWVLGGLLGGLASMLLSIPIALALFILLTRRHEARQVKAGSDELEERYFAAQDELSLDYEETEFAETPDEYPAIQYGYERSTTQHRWPDKQRHE